MKNRATISCDIISSTALSAANRDLLSEKLEELMTKLTQHFADQGFYGRDLKGDYIECALDAPETALRVALLIKTFVRAIELPTSKEENKRIKYFKEHGVRVAIAVAPLENYQPHKGVMDGEAIYLSGRALNRKDTHDKQKIVIKRTLYFLSSDLAVQRLYETMLEMLDVILVRCSAKQCEVVFYKLLNKSEVEIAKILKKNQSTINQHSTAAGWNAIDRAVSYFEENIH